MEKIEIKIMTEEELSSMDEETREVAQMLNSFETILQVSERFRGWGNQHHSNILKGAIETISNLYFGETKNVTEEEAETKIKSSIKEMDEIVKLLKDCDNEENADILKEAIDKIYTLTFGTDFYRDWDKTFDICYKIAMEKGDDELANEIKKYIGISKDQELGEDFAPLLERCIKILSNN